MVTLMSCSSTSTIPFLSKRQVQGDTINISAKRIKPFEISDCAVGVLIFSVNPLMDFEAELEKYCGKEWEIFNLVQIETKFMVPIVYGQYCRTVSGLCRK